MFVGEQVLEEHRPEEHLLEPEVESEYEFGDILIVVFKGVVDALQVQMAGIPADHTGVDAVLLLLTVYFVTLQHPQGNVLV